VSDEKPPDEVAERLHRVGDRLKRSGMQPLMPDPNVPLTSDELKLLESKAGVTGLSTETSAASWRTTHDCGGS
jgi:hypothetical protein